MTDTQVPVGIIEGFYGEVWHHEARIAAADWGQPLGFSFYIYAPKADPFLRKRWSESYPAQDLVRMKDLSMRVRESGQKFGIGLSPFELYLDWSGPSRDVFEQKIRELNDIGVDLLCILFDDMKGDVPGLAAMQAEIADAAAQIASADQIILCPTYYSDDPVLEKVFGRAPDDYLPELGQSLDSIIDVFWTGPKVCSPGYSVDHLADVAARLGRKPFLWDNYPVNDGARMSKHLHLRGVTGRGAEILPHISGIAANPMNEPNLSRLPLATLIASFNSGADYTAEEATSALAIRLAGAEVGGALLADLHLLHDIGREEMGDAERNRLISKYETFGHHPYAQEVVAFLRGDYVFDPACLTD